MNLLNFFTFFAAKLNYTKIYPNGYNILVGYGIYTITDIIWGERSDLSDWNGEWAGGTLKCAMHITILGNY